MTRLRLVERRSHLEPVERRRRRWWHDWNLPCLGVIAFWLLLAAGAWWLLLR